MTPEERVAQINAALEHPVNKADLAEFLRIANRLYAPIAEGGLNMIGQVHSHQGPDGTYFTLQLEDNKHFADGFVTVVINQDGSTNGAQFVPHKDII